MRRFIVDTDTASDDAVALVMALRHPGVRVEAITVVAGNAPLEQCVQNALYTAEILRRGRAGLCRARCALAAPAPARHPCAWRRRHGRHRAAAGRARASRRPRCRPAGRADQPGARRDHAGDAWAAEQYRAGAAARAAHRAAGAPVRDYGLSGLPVTEPIFSERPPARG